MAKLIPIFMLTAVASLLLSLLFGGSIVYQWVLACEATAASLILLSYQVRYYQDDPRASGILINEAGSKQ